MFVRAQARERRAINVCGVAMALLLLTLAAGSVQARKIYVPSHDELFKRSDLVVLASPTGDTHDTGEESVFSGIMTQDRAGHQSPVKAMGVETPFRIGAVLKGPALTEFVLHHYRTDGFPSLNGPMTLSFRQGQEEGSPGGSRGLEKEIFLLYLVREPDGRYAPAGGQTDPEMTTGVWLPCIHTGACTGSFTALAGDQGRSLPSPAGRPTSTVAPALEGGVAFLAGVLATVLAVVGARWFRRRAPQDDP